MKRKLASLTVLLAGLLLGLSRWLDPAGSGPPPPVRPPPVEQRGGSTAGQPTSSGPLAALGDASLDAQIGRVVAAMDATGRPPEGIAQGGRRGGRPGAFDNREGRLPVRGRGYYVESDVWPRGPGGRGVRRLVFGRHGEVYYTADHYRTFTRLR